jgi:hypothetical protein
MEYHKCAGRALHPSLWAPPLLRTQGRHAGVKVARQPRASHCNAAIGPTHGRRRCRGSTCACQGCPQTSSCRLAGGGSRLESTRRTACPGCRAAAKRVGGRVARAHAGTRRPSAVCCGGKLRYDVPYVGGTGGGKCTQGGLPWPCGVITPTVNGHQHEADPTERRLTGPARTHPSAGAACPSEQHIEGNPTPPARGGGGGGGGGAHAPAPG